MKLTDTAIRALKPREKLCRVADGHGLMIEVTPNGSKLWRYWYSWAGKEQMLALGVYPLTSLRAVREAHLELRRQLASGVSPSKVRIKPVELQRAQDGTLFKALVMDWLDERGKDTKPKTLQKTETLLSGQVHRPYPVTGHWSRHTVLKGPPQPHDIGPRLTQHVGHEVCRLCGDQQAICSKPSTRAWPCVASPVRGVG